MLRSISWGQFITFLLLAGVVYYLYVFVRYYRREGIGFLAKMRERAGQEAGASPIDTDKSQVAEGPVQTRLFDTKESKPGQAAELFNVMEKVVELLKGVVAQGIVDGDEPGLMMEYFRQILSKYGYLKGTPYQVAINNFLIRTCSKSFSMVLGEQELESLWV
jgi:hypothetical protein